MEKTLEKAEDAGRGGDRFLGHLSPGDVVIPRGMMKEEWREFLRKYFDVDTYTVGHKKNSLNPITGLPEFADGVGGGGGFDNANTGVDATAAAGQEAATANGGWGGFAQAIGDFFGRSEPVDAGFGTMDQMGTGGGMDTSAMNNPLQIAASQVAPVNYGAAVPELNAPTAPNVPDSLPRIGEYYSLLNQGNSAAAENMLRQFMRGDTNVYGR